MNATVVRQGVRVNASAVLAEWTKLRTTPGPGWLLVATVAVTVALGSAVCVDGCDVPRIALSGVYLGQATVAVLGVLVVGTEFSCGLIRTTLAAVPSRAVVLGAKALVLAVPVAIAAAVAVGVCLTRLPTHDGPVLRPALGTTVYLVLIAVMSVGVAAVVRDPGAAIGTVLGLLYLPPILVRAVSDSELREFVEKVSPMSAGLAVQATTDLDRLPIGPWAGLGALAGWAAAALLAGFLALRLRDT
ncbi:ABC transporter permease [Actinoplanes philippinensis]|uniref:ABC transporter permease n=1 Tax=Actinoplanes philippinensis TaxID=35752 RepID=UPI0033D0E4B1